ncbi:alpha-1,2-fucosyltransferase [Chitinophaga lutea]|uniref:Alpha-1,2-fucosyltransferase n=2 Tax=Chitinophaga lutea TaxID=2488634 RepID=A0A3N4PVH8_9BACT|nr:alpha-1,2-fucosyltransferase [Chitinophaga lutea]
MIVVKLAGGIGNQMFQYAFGRYLSVTFGFPLFLDISLYKFNLSNRTFDLNIFRLHKDIMLTDQDGVASMSRGRATFYLNEQSFHFNDLIERTIRETAAAGKDAVYVIIGYWQSERYFETITGAIRNEFRFAEKTGRKFQQLNKRISGENAVMVNVRRGDYLEHLDYHGVVSPEYIQRAMALIMQKTDSPHFFIFSDDIPWCREHIMFYDNITLVDEKYYDAQFRGYLELMTNCRHFIIANSTFSWWSAWLAPNKEKIVIAPEKWFEAPGADTKDLLQEEWIRL